MAGWERVRNGEGGKGRLDKGENCFYMHCAGEKILSWKDRRPKYEFCYRGLFVLGKIFPLNSGTLE